MSVLAGGPAGAGIILNTLQGYDDQALGWTGRLDGSFSASGGNTDQKTLASGGRIQYKRAGDRLRLQLDGGYRKTNGAETARNVVVHLRYNRELTARWSGVSFGQIQHNPFQRLRSRWLWGVGPRFDLVRDDQSVVAVGATPMLEIERLENEAGSVTRGRLSVFLILVQRLSSTAKLEAVAFWQPLLGDFSNSRTVANLALAVDVTGAVELRVGAALEDNAQPPSGVERTDWSSFTGLGVKF